MSSWDHHTGDAPADAPAKRHCRGRCCIGVLCVECGASKDEECREARRTADTTEAP